MIEFAKEKNIDDIKKLWKEAFGDEDISEFLKCYKENIIVYTEGEKLCGMLSMLPVNMGVKRGRYIYAVATHKNFRGRGISTELLNWAREYSESAGEKFLILVPAEKSLFEFYKKRGYTAVSSVEKKEFQRQDHSLEVKKISADEIYEKRNNYFRNRIFARWEISDLEYISKMYDGHFYSVSDGEGEAFCVCSFYNGNLEIKELCSGSIREELCASAIMDIFNVEKCIAVLPSENGEPFAMVSPECDVYFNLAMD